MVIWIMYLLKKIKEFEKSFLSVLNINHKDVLNSISSGEWNKDIQNVLSKEAKNLSAQYNKN
jgi:F-type H+-transporting ATPase subunit alpha